MRICLVVSGYGQFSGLCILGIFVNWPVYWPLRVKGLQFILTSLFSYVNIFSKCLVSVYFRKLNFENYLLYSTDY